MSNEVFTLLDTAIKIGLGALIAGLFSFLVSAKNSRNEIKKMWINEKVTMVKDLAVKIESIEYCINECAYQFHSSNLVEARKCVLTATKEAYSAMALSNLVSSDELVGVLNSMSKIVERIYHELQEDEPNLDELDAMGSEITSLKTQSYPLVRKAYKFDF